MPKYVYEYIAVTASKKIIEILFLSAIFFSYLAIIFRITPIAMYISIWICAIIFETFIELEIM